MATQSVVEAKSSGTAEAEVCASCSAACPVHTDTRRYAQLVSEGRYEEAFDVIRSVNPFPSVCGRICHHPCEEECRRTRVDAGVALRDLKRFISEQAREYRKKTRKPAERKWPEKVAVIGSGPAGLTAAADLARKGYAVTVFERLPAPGGLLGMAIPRYRLPFEILKEDIDDITALGVEIRTGVEVGKDVTIPQLQAEGYKAVLVSSGLTESRSVAVPGIDTDGVLLAIPFLQSVCFGRPLGIGKNVLVIGGGNVAIDVARTARRLGPESVTMACLESRDEMPAWDWEVKEAEEEGIKIICSRGPKSVIVKDGHVAGLEVKECTAVFDAQKRFNPTFNESNVSQIACDTIIIAIGQRGDLGCLKDAGVALTERGQIKFDVATLSTSVPGIFASGEVVTGPGAAIEAVASGHRAATAMDFFLRHGRLTDVPVEKPTALGQIPDETIPKIPKAERAKMPQLAPAERVTNLKEFEAGLSEAAALREARRCMSCALGAVADKDKCASCLTCVRICPFGVATVDKTAVMSNEKCQACGLCAAECPAMAVKLERFSAEETRGKLKSLVAQLPAKPEPLVAAFCCSLQTTKREQLDTSADEVARTGIVRLVVPCVARLNVVDVLAAFEAGATGACVIACPPGAPPAGCRYPNADLRLKQRLDRAKRMLDEIGLGGNRLRLYYGVHGPEKDWPAFTQAFREEVKQIK